MQSDFHYNAVYCLARLAGLTTDSSLKIATASQFVDESVDDQILATDKKEKMIPSDQLRPEVTAHHTIDFKNTDLDDQRMIWVPFHFLPGGGEGGYNERLVCKKNSDIAQAMLEHYLSRLDVHFGLELVGVAAHVYADTFAHYGFSGVSSSRNMVVNSTLSITASSENEETEFKEYLTGFFGEYGEQGGIFSYIKRSLTGAIAEWASGALGHGAVTTCPDWPYLTWNFEYELADKFEARAKSDGKRDNPKNYLEACEKLWSFFLKVKEVRPDWADGSIVRPLEQWRSEAKKIIAVKAEKDGRAQAWSEALVSGVLTGTPEEIPIYPGKALSEARKGFPEMPKPVNPAEFDLYRFFQAASYHRHYVLRELLPAHGMMVI